MRALCKTSEEIELMRESCQITAKILDEVGDIIEPGISTEQINSYVHKRITDHGGVPSTLNYKGYPKSCCTSLNEIVCHGIPSPLVVLKEGDILNVDVTTFKNGFHGDASRMYFVGGRGACSDPAVCLVDATKEALMKAIGIVKPGKRIGDIGAEIQQYVKSLKRGYGIVREYTGHGIGREFHEGPQVLHIGKRGTGELIKEGMTFTIEPMINMGTSRTTLSPIDGWTVRTADNRLSAQWEHTIAVTADGVDILTYSEKF